MMINPAQAEGLLAVLYTCSTLLSITSVICLIIAWQHWAWTLDVCVDVDCGCILYGIKTFDNFLGGDVKLCHFASFGLVPAIAIGLCLAAYHGYRCCIDKNLYEPRRTSRVLSYDANRNNYIEQVTVGPRRRSPCKQWTPAAFCAALICFLSLAHAVVMTDGYYKTCEQYRRILIQMLGSGGREAQAIHNRLACGAIFDFMDYLQPDTNNWIRGYEINTGLTLQLAITSTWFNFFSWVFVCFVNLFMAKKMHNNLEESRFCC